MKRRAWIAAAIPLLLLVSLAILAPWLPLRDPAAQPDGLVLRELPPLSRVHRVLLSSGEALHGSALRRTDDGGLELLRGSAWRRVESAELAGDGAATRPLYLLGTDGYGRDLFSRLIWGARVSLAVGVAAVVLAGGLGILIGLAAGTFGGWVDGLLMRTTDLFLSVPRLFLALLLISLHGPSLVTTIAVLGATTWMPAARLVRAEVVSARERDWARAATASGLGPLRIAWFHLLPAAITPLSVEATLRVGDTILLEAALSFLGLGVPAPTASWGNLVADGRGSLLDAWWVATLPGLAIAGTVIGLHIVGETLRQRRRVRDGQATLADGDRLPDLLQA